MERAEIAELFYNALIGCNDGAMVWTSVWVGNHF